MQKSPLFTRFLWCFLACLCLPIWAQADASLSVQWSVDVDGRQPQDTAAFAAPAIVGVGAAQRIVLGGADARAHIYDMSGKELLRVPLQQSSDSGAVGISDTLAVLGDSKGHLYGIDVMHGSIVWTFKLSASLTGMPVRLGHDVLVQTTDNSLYRIDAHGKKVWSFTAQQGGLGLYLSATPLVFQNHIYALLTNGDAISVDAKNGDLLWRKQLLLDTDAAMLKDLKAPQATPMYLKQVSFDGRTLQDVVLFPFYQGDVFVLNRNDGNVMHREHISLKSTPLLLDGMLYLADTHGTLTAIHVNTGVRAWQTSVSSFELQGPIWWHDALWVTDESGVLFQVSQHGKIQASVDTQGAVERAPLPSQQGLLLHHTLGGLYLIHE